MDAQPSPQMVRSPVGRTNALSWLRTGGALAIAALSLAAFYVWSYGDCTGRFFSQDDFWEIKAVSTIRIVSPLDIAQFFRPVPSFLLYRPVSTLMYFYALRQFFGHDPAMYHATQIAFHILNALLVYAIASRLFSSQLRGLAAAFVYATAPGHAIAACWMALFTMTGTAFFFFLALWGWLALQGRWRVPVTLLLFVIALLASEHALSFPIVLTLASLLLAPRCDWRRMAREQASFYLIAVLYVGAKLVYMRYIMPYTSPFPGTRYSLSLDPRLLLAHIGLYLRYGIDALYAMQAEEFPTLFAGIAATLIATVATLCAVFGRLTSRPLRIATFGLDLFIVTLGPVIVLQEHQYSYYVGISALGLALLLIGLTSALPRLSVVATCALATGLVLVHVFSTAAAVRQGFDFRLFDGGSESAAGWLYAMTMIRSQTANEVVLPKNPVTEWLVGGDAQKVFLCAHYRLRTVEHPLAEPLAAGRIFLLWWKPLPDPPDCKRSWAWLQQPCAQQGMEPDP